MQTFSELLTDYMDRTGISDAELARSVGVRRQTIFRWKEGLVSRPRHRDDVLRCARRLRLTAEEQDTLLIAAGFPPENASAAAVTTRTAEPAPVVSAEVVERIEREMAQPATPTLPVRWVAVIASFVAVGILAVAVWLVQRPASYPVAGAGETLIVVGRFVNYAGGQQGYNVAGRVRDALADEVEEAGLGQVRIVVWPDEIGSKDAATGAAQRAGARMVIWGEYDAGRVVARFTLPGAEADSDEPALEQLVATPGDLTATINSDVPREVRYLGLLTLGRLYVDQEDYDQAQAVLNQALVRPPAESDALATLYFVLGYVSQTGAPADLDKAIGFYSEVVSLQPALVSAYNNRGIAYLHRGQAGDLDRAAEDLSRAIAAQPENAFAYNNRGAAYLRRDAPGDLARAIEDFGRAISLAPEAPEAYFNRGLAYVRAGEREKWQANFEHVLALNPEHAGAYNAVCWAYALDQQPDLALPYCDQAVELDPTAFSRDSRGIVYAQLGRFDDAAAEFRAFLSWLDGQPASEYARYGSQREAWLEELDAGQNPFDADTLERLRRE